MLSQLLCSEDEHRLQPLGTDVSLSLPDQGEGGIHVWASFLLAWLTLQSLGSH